MSNANKRFQARMQEGIDEIPSKGLPPGHAHEGRVIAKGARNKTSDNTKISEPRSKSTYGGTIFIDPPPEDELPSNGLPPGHPFARRFGKKTTKENKEKDGR